MVQNMWSCMSNHNLKLHNKTKKVPTLRQNNIPIMHVIFVTNLTNATKIKIVCQYRISLKAFSLVDIVTWDRKYITSKACDGKLMEGHIDVNQWSQCS